MRPLNHPVRIRRLGKLTSALLTHRRQNCRDGHSKFERAARRAQRIASRQDASKPWGGRSRQNNLWRSSRQTENPQRRRSIALCRTGTHQKRTHTFFGAVATLAFLVFYTMPAT